MCGIYTGIYSNIDLCDLGSKKKLKGSLQAIYHIMIIISSHNENYLRNSEGKPQGLFTQRRKTDADSVSESRRLRKKMFPFFQK